MASTTNFGWTTPDNTGYVKDGALAIRTLGSAIDTSMAELKGGTTGQVLKKTSGTDMDFEWGTVSSTPRIGQVVQATTTTGTTTTSTSYVDATNMTATITPTLSTSKVLVTMNFDVNFDGNPGSVESTSYQIVRGSTAVYEPGYMITYIPSGVSALTFSNRITLVYLDSPATTSATTYKLQFKKGSQTSSTINYPGGAASVILQEVLV